MVQLLVLNLRKPFGFNSSEANKWFKLSVIFRTFLTSLKSFIRCRTELINFNAGFCYKIKHFFNQIFQHSIILPFLNKQTNKNFWLKFTFATVVWAVVLCSPGTSVNHIKIPSTTTKYLFLPFLIKTPLCLEVSNYCCSKKRKTISTQMFPILCRFFFFKKLKMVPRQHLPNSWFLHWEHSPISLIQIAIVFPIHIFSPSEFLKKKKAFNSNLRNEINQQHQSIT